MHQYLSKICRQKTQSLYREDTAKLALKPTERVGKRTLNPQGPPSNVFLVGKRTDDVDSRPKGLYYLSSILYTEKSAGTLVLDLI